MMNDKIQWELTLDGSFTFYSQEWKESFHSRKGAKTEAQLKFVEPTQLAQKAVDIGEITILDICYGLGYNTAAALTTIWEHNPQCLVKLIALEVNLDIPQSANFYDLPKLWSEEVGNILIQLAETRSVNGDKLQAELIIQDARISIQQIYHSFKADAIFLDPFSPPVCPQLWTLEFLNLVSQSLKPDGLLATYSCAASVRTALIASGLRIGSTPPMGRRTPGTIAGLPPLVFTPLSPPEVEHLLTRAAIPYRDPNLTDSADIIKQRRLEEQLSSNLEPTSHWKKRWDAKMKL